MSQVKKAVITAAGRGTRQFPATNTIQKELFPLVDVDGLTKPALQIIVEEALNAGIEEICIVANPSNVEPIRRHFRGVSDFDKRNQFRGKVWALRQSDVLDDIGERLTIVIQEKQEGYGHAVAAAKEWVGDDPFALLLGDHVYQSNTPANCTAQVLAAYDLYRYPVSSVARTPESIISRFGTIQGTRMDDGCWDRNLPSRRGAVPMPPSYWITQIEEKPTIEFAREHLRVDGLGSAEYLCFFGIHVFGPAIFEIIDHLIAHDIRERGEIQLATAQAILVRTGQYVACEVDGIRYDIGVPDGLVETQVALALRSPYKSQIQEMLSERATMSAL
jgi:UTP--glucose-1-phosphate uridylyltransferase